MVKEDDNYEEKFRVFIGQTVLDQQGGEAGQGVHGAPPAAAQEHEGGRGQR